MLSDVAKVNPEHSSLIGKVKLAVLESVALIVAAVAVLMSLLATACAGIAIGVALMLNNEVLEVREELSVRNILGSQLVSELRRLPIDEELLDRVQEELLNEQTESSTVQPESGRDSDGSPEEDR